MMTPTPPADCPRDDCPYDARIRRLEVDSALYHSTATSLQDAVEALNATVHELRDTINRGRGAVWLLILVSGAIGAAITTVSGWLKAHE